MADGPPLLRDLHNPDGTVGVLLMCVAATVDGMKSVPSDIRTPEVVLDVLAVTVEKMVEKYPRDVLAAERAWLRWAAERVRELAESIRELQDERGGVMDVDRLVEELRDALDEWGKPDGGGAR